ncbi:MAG: hypothetical protein DRN96_06185 [Thermoproteota archaeon]|nr:MAG: hypothetical protein DRN96_06185 [Candidatus Korarchaeota archaeon]
MTVVEWLDKAEERAREVRRRMADWSFIERQPPRIKAALIYYVKTGDLRRAQRIAGLKLEEFIDLIKRAGIPTGL